MNEVPSLTAITEELVAELAHLQAGPPVAFIYRPLEYASAVYREFVRRFGVHPRRYMLVGMNPGPWGMAQTGVPFGAVSKVRDWMGLTAPIDRPSREHPKRPVLGFECRREEVSGRRLWSWAQQTYGTPESFFESFWVTNYCPLLFLDEKGRNVTPDKLAKRDRERILPPCDRALALTAQALSIQKIVAIGVWAEQRVRIACAHLPLEIGRILHPSPASPAANRGWATIATRQLRDLGVELPPEHQ